MEVAAAVAIATTAIAELINIIAIDCVNFNRAIAIYDALPGCMLRATLKTEIASPVYASTREMWRVHVTVQG